MNGQVSETSGLFSCEVGYFSVKGGLINREGWAVHPKYTGRFVFEFTPTHGSWLNLIESFFSKKTKQMLKRIRVKSKKELAERIYLYFDEVNSDPVVYHWTYKLDEISVDESKNNVAI